MLPVILHRDDYVILKEDGDFLRFSNGEIIIYREYLQREINKHQITEEEMIINVKKN